MTFSLLYALLTEIEVILRLFDCESKTFGNKGALFNGLKKIVFVLLYELLHLECLLFFVLSSLSPKHMAKTKRGTLLLVWPPHSSLVVDFMAIYFIYKII